VTLVGALALETGSRFLETLRSTTMGF